MDDSVCHIQLTEILSDDGHDVHMLVSESYDRFEHRDDPTRRAHIPVHHRCSSTFTEQSLSVNSASSCSLCNDTSQSRYAGWICTFCVS